MKKTINIIFLLYWIGLMFRKTGNCGFIGWNGIGKAVQPNSPAPLRFHNGSFFRTESRLFFRIDAGEIGGVVDVAASVIPGLLGVDA